MLVSLVVDTGDLLGGDTSSADRIGVEVTNLLLQLQSIGHGHCQYIFREIRSSSSHMSEQRVQHLLDAQLDLHRIVRLLLLPRNRASLSVRILLPPKDRLQVVLKVV